MARQTANGTPEDEIQKLREEQRRLSLRQDTLERSLKNRAPRSDDAKNKTNGKDKRPDEEEKEEDEEEEKETVRKPSRRERLLRSAHDHPLRAALIALAALLAIVGGILFYLHTLSYEDTDDAEIDGDISSISARVSGTVIAVHVINNQVVHAGDPIADLDPRDYEAALSRARADLAQAEAQLRAEEPTVPITTVTNRTSISTSIQEVATATAALASAERELAQAEAEVARSVANDRYAQIESNRTARLAVVGAVAISQSDQRTFAADATAAAVEAQKQAVLAAQKRVDEQRAGLAAAETRLHEARANAPKQLEARRATVALREAAIVAARAQLEQAELNRSYAQIVAPVDGIIGDKSVNVGDHVQPGQQLVAITQTTDLWVTANFRETQLRNMHPKQAVRFHVDAIDLDFRGELLSTPGATGARYSLLPPENATGNYVKVVQRLPVRITIDANQKGYDRLRPGMSVEPRVTVK